MATRGRSARQKGHDYERKIVKELREFLLFPDAVTSRSESKRTDDLGIDIMYTDPFNIQCKAVEKLGSVHKILADMPQGSNYNVIFHKRNRLGEVVVMSKDDFYEILQMLIRNQII